VDLWRIGAVKASSPIPASHLLHAHHGDVFLRRLHAPLNCTEINLDRIYSVPLHNLRVKVRTHATAHTHTHHRTRTRTTAHTHTHHRTRVFLCVWADVDETRV
jgi:hypothetical protein